MRARLLGEADRAQVLRIVQADPVANVFVASRVEAGVLSPGSPGELWGYPSAEPHALLHVGANLVPLNMDAAARAAFVNELGPFRSFSAIVGQANQVFELWRALSERHGASYRRTRLIRERQPVMATASRCPNEPDPRVAPVGPEHFDSYFSAAVAMYTEELEEDPLVSNALGYRRYVEGLIASGRAFGIVEDGRVVFKADIGATGGGVSQVQGVWVAPALRGRGIAGPAMAAVTNAIVDAGRTASLYVNRHNAPAIATYRRCGYTDRTTFATILY